MDVHEFLSATELAELSGRKTPSAQKRWLDAQGWRFIENAAGRPIVNRQYCRWRMGLDKPKNETPIKEEVLPNFGAIA